MNVLSKFCAAAAALFVACALVLPLGVKSVDAYAEPGIGFSVGLYSDADRTSLLTELTSTGSQHDDWDFDEASDSPADRYLGISLSGLDMHGQYQLVIEMDPILYVNQNADPSHERATVSFTKNDDLVVNTDGKYVTEKYSLSNLTYLFQTGTESLTLGIPLRFDVNLWNKQNGGALGNGSDSLLHVYLQKKVGSGWETMSNCDVKLMQATVKGKVSYSPARNTYLEGGSSTATNNMGAGDTLKMLFSHFTASTYAGGHYAKDVKVELTLPKCTIGGNTYTMGYRNFSFSTSGGSSVFSTSDTSGVDGKVTFAAENFYFNGEKLFQTYFYAPESIKDAPKGKYVFSGSISVVEDGVPVAADMAITINVDTDTEPILKVFASTNGTANIVELDVVQPFGNLAIRNEAATKNGSGPLKFNLTFDSNDTKAVSVTTVNLMCDRDAEEIFIEYTLVNRDGNPAYGGQAFTTKVTNRHYSATDKTIRDSHYITFTRSDLPVEEHRQYYFKTLSYTMKNLPGGSYAYHTGAGKAPYSAGTIWGYVNVNEIPSTLPTHSLEVYRLDEYKADAAASSLGLNGQIKVVFDAGTKIPYGLDDGKVSASSVMAGDSVTISGRIFVPSYPYSSNNCLNDMCLGILLPAGVTVNEASISASYAGGSLGVRQVTSKSPAAGENLYIIEFEQGQKIGYYNERLSALANGSTLSFSLQLNSEKSMSAQTINLRECVFAAGKGRINSSGGTYADHSINDRYDLNDNGSTADTVACFGSETTASIYFGAAPARLEITDSLRNSEGMTGSNLEMMSFADVLTYDLDVKCTEGGSATGFYYIIPVADTTMQADPAFVSLCENKLKLHDAVTVATAQGTPMKVLYATAAVSSYSDAVTLSDESWFETLPAGKSFEDVTLIKVVSSSDSIQNGSVSTISVPLKYDGIDTEYAAKAGYKISWSSRGYYHYRIGHNESAGARSTAGCSITLTYTPQETIEFTLTAAKKEPGEDPSPKATSYFDLPVFIKAQHYSVKQVSTYNVNLKNASYDFSTASSAEANENFRVTVSVKKASGDAVGSAPVAIEKGGEIIGDLGGNTAPRFTFTIDNANALSDIVTVRYVELVLVGDNGVIVPVKINIARELAPADPTASAIVAGELYSPFDGGTAATVSQDSAFTAQFITKYVLENYKDRTLEFQYAPAQGTTVTMIDWTDANIGDDDAANDTLRFYRYVFDGSTSSVKLTSFAGMGGASSYVEPTSGGERTERLLFVVDFPDSGEPLRSNGVLELTKVLKAGGEKESASLQVTTVAKRTFGMEAKQGGSALSPDSSILQGSSVDVLYSAACSVTDSRFADRNFALVVAPASGASFPATSCLTVDGGKYHLNSDGSFVVPLKAVQVGGGEIALSYESGNGEGAGLVLTLWASATANGAKPFMGEVVAGPLSISVAPAGSPSLKVVRFAPDRLLSRADGLSDVVVDYDALGAKSVTLELQKKEDAGYVTQTTVLESVNGKTAADAGQGVFYVSKDDGSAELRLSARTLSGTYRVLLTATSANGDRVEVPFNFIVED